MVPAEPGSPLSDKLPFLKFLCLNSFASNSYRSDENNGEDHQEGAEGEFTDYTNVIVIDFYFFLQKKCDLENYLWLTIIIIP